MSNLYNEIYEFSGFKKSEGLKRDEARQRLQLIAQVAPKVSGTPHVILDIGCGHGFFLDEARRIGFSTRGIEASCEPREYAQFTLGQPVNEDLNSVRELSSGSLQIATLWHVIEHLRDPRPLIRDLYSLLAPGGVLAIACPNIESLSAKIMGLDWHWLAYPYHVSHFGRRSLTYLLEAEGFKVVKVVTHETRASRSLPTILLWHWTTRIARQIGLPSLKERKISAQQDSDISIYHAASFGLSPYRFGAWIIRQLGAIATIILFPIIYLFWKLDLGTEIELYAIKDIQRK